MQSVPSGCGKGLWHQIWGLSNRMNPVCKRSAAARLLARPVLAGRGQSGGNPRAPGTPPRALGCGRGGGRAAGAQGGAPGGPAGTASPAPPGRSQSAPHTAPPLPPPPSTPGFVPSAHRGWEKKYPAQPRAPHAAERRNQAELRDLGPGTRVTWVCTCQGHRHPGSNRSPATSHWVTVKDVSLSGPPLRHL